VTGAARYNGIGRQIALGLARQGVNLVLTDIILDPARYPAAEREIGWTGLESMAAEAVALGVQALPLVSDVSDPGSVADAVAAAVARFGAIDFLINNAGAPVGADRVPLVDLPLDQWERVMRVNLSGAFLMSQAAARHMIGRGQGGAIINISSIASRQAPAGSGAYASSKAGLNTLSRVLAMELAQHQIRVNSLLPGLIKSSRISDAVAADWEGLVKRFTPMGVAGDGTEIAAMCTFLCSAQGQWITGQDIAIDGGSSWR
jgi:3-oxoacyl-[acyl-carrier protein] reductase